MSQKTSSFPSCLKKLQMKPTCPLTMEKQVLMCRPPKSLLSLRWRRDRSLRRCRTIWRWEKCKRFTKLTAIATATTNKFRLCIKRLSSAKTCRAWSWVGTKKELWVWAQEERCFIRSLTEHSIQRLRARAPNAVAKWKLSERFKVFYPNYLRLRNLKMTFWWIPSQPRIKITICRTNLWCRKKFSLIDGIDRIKRWQTKAFRSLNATLSTLGIECNTFRTDNRQLSARIYPVEVSLATWRSKSKLKALRSDLTSRVWNTW